MKKYSKIPATCVHPPTGQGAAEANRSGAQEGDKGLDLLLLGAASNPCSGINHLILVVQYFSIL